MKFEVKAFEQFFREKYFYVEAESRARAELVVRRELNTFENVVKPHISNEWNGNLIEIIVTELKDEQGKTESVSMLQRKSC
jgi:hypothetical protein